MNVERQLTEFILTSANIDKRKVIEDWMGVIAAEVIEDKGYIGRNFHEKTRYNNAIMIALSRKNIEKVYSDDEMKFYMKIRRRIEATIGQRIEKFNLTKIIAHSAKNCFN